MENEARLLNGIPYSWGGGHQNPAWVVSSGYDCSGFVSDILHSAGYLSSPQTTQTLPAAKGLYLPLKTSRGVVGVLGVHPADPDSLASPERLHFLEAFANQIALAVE